MMRTVVLCALLALLLGVVSAGSSCVPVNKCDECQSTATLNVMCEVIQSYPEKKWGCCHQVPNTDGKVVNPKFRKFASNAGAATGAAVNATKKAFVAKAGDDARCWRRSSECSLSS